MDVVPVFANPSVGRCKSGATTSTGSTRRGRNYPLQLPIRGGRKDDSPARAVLALPFVDGLEIWPPEQRPPRAMGLPWGPGNDVACGKPAAFLGLLPQLPPPWGSMPIVLPSSIESTVARRRTFTQAEKSWQCTVPAPSPRLCGCVLTRRADGGQHAAGQNVRSA
jgi:hypothetical protein